jgi:hypothetical protein
MHAGALHRRDLVLAMDAQVELHSIERSLEQQTEGYVIAPWWCLELKAATWWDGDVIKHRTRIIADCGTASYVVAWSELGPHSEPRIPVQPLSGFNATDANSTNVVLECEYIDTIDPRSIVSNYACGAQKEADSKSRLPHLEEPTNTSLFPIAGTV